MCCVSQHLLDLFRRWWPELRVIAAAERHPDVPYERSFENNNRRGPKRKSRWIEEGDLRLGDSELIL